MRKKSRFERLFYFAYELIKTQNKIDVNSCQKPTARKGGDTMLTTEEIKQFLDEDSASELKKNARIGQKYYEAEQDRKSVV